MCHPVREDSLGMVHNGEKRGEDQGEDDNKAQLTIYDWMHLQQGTLLTTKRPSRELFWEAEFHKGHATELLNEVNVVCTFHSFF